MCVWWFWEERKSPSNLAPTLLYTTSSTPGATETRNPQSDKSRLWRYSEVAGSIVKGVECYFGHVPFACLLRWRLQIYDSKDVRSANQSSHPGESAGRNTLHENYMVIEGWSWNICWWYWIKTQFCAFGLAQYYFANTDKHSLETESDFFKEGNERTAQWLCCQTREKKKLRARYFLKAEVGHSTHDLKILTSQSLPIEGKKDQPECLANCLKLMAFQYTKTLRLLDRSKDT